MKTFGERETHKGIFLKKQVLEFKILFPDTLYVCTHKLLNN